MASSGSGDMEEVSLAMNKVSIQVVQDEPEVKKEKKVDRHCSFCLTLVPGEEVKLCSKCKRRAYCSKECQTADWKSPKEMPAFNGKIHGYGQGHKNWCGLPYGEEDLDWKVAPINGKHLGLVALRDLPPLYRIIVDGMQAEPVLGINGRYTPYHPGMNDLDPLSTTNVGKKFDFNSINTATDTNAIAKLGLRFSRTNHSCDPNACSADDSEFHVLILYSIREIKPGEEICFPYARFNDIGKKDDPDKGKSPDFFRKVLFFSWGIVCPPSCPCRDLEKLEMLKKARELFAECERDCERENVLPKMEKVIETAGKIGCDGSTISALYYYAGEYTMARRGRQDLEKAKEYLEMFLQRYKAIYHPDNWNQVKRWENVLKDLKAQTSGFLGLFEKVGRMFR